MHSECNSDAFLSHSAELDVFFVFFFFRFEKQTTNLPVPLSARACAHARTYSFVIFIQKQKRYILVDETWSHVPRRLNHAERVDAWQLTLLLISLDV